MSSFMVFFLLSLVFWGGLIYRTWQMNDDEKAQISSQLQAVKEQSTERLQALSLSRANTVEIGAEFAPSFRAWCNDSALLPADLYQWTVDLPDEHFEVITEFVAQFCADMGFELQSVVEGGYAEDMLDDTLERVIIHTLNAMKLIFGVREELLAHDNAQLSAQPELAGQIQQMMSTGKASINGVLNRSGLTGGGSNGYLNGHSNGHVA